MVPSKFRTPKISMMMSGRKRLKKTAARLRMNIFALATKRAQRTPKAHRSVLLPQVVPGEVDEDVLQVGEPLDAAFVKPRPSERVDQACGVSRATIRPRSMIATRSQSSSASSM